MKIWKYLALLGFIVPAQLLAAQVEIHSPWLKETIPGSENGAAYLTITNVGLEPVAIVGASTHAARLTEIHQHRMADGMMVMERLPQLTLQADETVVFQPGGYHLMLFGINRPFKPGDTVEFILQFNDGNEVPFTAEVRSIHE